MHLFYADETNLNPTSGMFFVYGGVAIPGASAPTLYDDILRIRSEYNIPDDVLLKFNPRPKSLSHTEFTALKGAIIQASVEAGCHLLVSLVLHDIARDTQQARRYGIDTVLGHFNRHLKHVDAHGIVLIDRFADREIDGVVRERISVGLRWYAKPQITFVLDRILGIHYSAIGQSPYCSLIDIALGSFRYAVNELTATKDGHARTARELLRIISPLMLTAARPGRISELSLCFRPEVIHVPAYQQHYVTLRSRLASCGMVV